MMQHILQIAHTHKLDTTWTRFVHAKQTATNLC